MEQELDMASMVNNLGSELGFDDPSGGADDAGDLELDVAPPSEKPAPEPGAEVPPAAGEPPAEGAEADPTAAKPTPGPDDPPLTWRKEAAAEWAGLSPTIKAEIQKREQDMFTGLETYKQDASWGKAVKGLLSPYEQIMREHNIEPMQQLGNLMNAHHTLATGSPQVRADMLSKLLKDYRVDPALVRLPDDPVTPPFQDPEVLALRSDVQAIKLQREGEVRAQLNSTIDTFFKDPARPYVNDLALDIARLIEKGLAPDLASAYDQAIWLNPAVRAKELQRQTAATEASRKVEAEAKAAEARKASAANVKAKAKSGSTAAPLGTMDDTMEATLAAIRSRSGS